MWKRIATSMAACLFSFGVAACGSSSSGGGSQSSGGSSSSTAPGASGSLGPSMITQQTIAQGLKYTDGKAGKLTPAAFAAQAKAFTGPAPMIQAKINCADPAEPGLPVLCANAVAISQFANGAWQSVGSYAVPGG